MTIDLNGFELHGANIASHGITGVQVGTTIRNGTITGFRFDGINVTGDRATVENMQITGNGRFGVQLYPGEIQRVINNTVTGNGRHGIECNHCIVTGSVLAANGGAGINAGVGTFVGNFFSRNGTYGLGSSSVGAGHAHNAFYLNAASGSPTGQVLNTQQLHPNLCHNEPCP